MVGGRRGSVSGGSSTQVTDRGTSTAAKSTWPLTVPLHPARDDSPKSEGSLLVSMQTGMLR